MKRIILLVLLSLVLASFAYAAARWYPTTAVYEMKEKAFVGYCPSQGQCLVGTGPDYNESLNNQPEKYFTSSKPRCIDNGQYILDYYCDNGKWASRTKLIALALLKFANRVSQNDYTLYCDKFDKVFNQVMYSNIPGGSVIRAMFSDYRCFNNQYPCYNHVCVLNYRGTIGIGMSFNSQINDTYYSPLLAMNQSVTHCSSVPQTSTDFVKCSSTSKFFYNPSIQSIIYLPVDEIRAGVTYDSATYIDPVFNSLNSYVEDEIPDAHDYFDKTTLFNRIYFAKKGTKKIFGFHEVDQKALGTDYKSYFGVSYQGHSFGSSPCFNIFRQIQGVDVYCENQPSTSEFLVVGKKTSTAKIGSFNVWQDLTSKLRPQAQ